MVKIRLGVIGLGEAWEATHKPALRALSDRFEVRAICDGVALRAEQAARQFDAKAVDGFRALTAREDIDAVLVLSPVWYGVLPILAACDAGKAVYCAVALDVGPQRVEEVRERVERSGVAFMAEFPRRQAAATLRLKELIATRLGEPRLLFCHERMRGAGGNDGQGGGSSSTTRNLSDLVDWCRYVAGRDPTSVLSVRHGGLEEGEDDYRMMSLDFSQPGAVGGPMAQISCGSYLSEKWPEAISFRPPSQLQVCCADGVAFIDLPTTLIWFDEAGRHMESLENERPVGEQLLSQFHRGVTSLVRRTNDLEDAYRALQIVLSAESSCQSGRRIPLRF